jgi:diguanylate cyclase (GGDEF)-like protein/PAS domain S-box-containing protein
MSEDTNWKIKYEEEKALRIEAQKLLKKKTVEYSQLTKTLKKQKNELETIFETTIDGIAILDLKSNFLFFNKAYQLMTGYSKEELLNKNCFELSNLEDHEKIKEVIKNTLEKGHYDNFEKTCIKKDGKNFMVNISFALMPDTQSILITVKDITEYKNKERLISSYVDLIDHNIITSSTDLKGIITYASHAFCEMSGYTQKELIGKNHNIIRHPDMPKEAFADLWKTISNNKTWEGEVKNRKKDGGYYWVHASISPIFDADGEKIGYTAIRQDITSRKKAEKISITDGLTGVYNRRHFNETFPKVLNNAKRNDGLVSFMIMDIDHFKLYNDTYGHHMGDQTLIKVASTIRDSLKRIGDYCFRLGGEEFAVIFEVESEHKAEAFAKIIKDRIENLKIDHSANSTSKYITVSIGLICKNATKLKDIDEVYKAADNLLYEAKKSGRNKVCS